MERYRLYALFILLLIILVYNPVSAEEIRLLNIETISMDVDFPISLCSFDKDTIVFTEKEGLLRVIKNEVLQKEPLKKFDVTTGFERGLLGIACKDKKIYVYYTYTSGIKTYNRVASLFPEKTILDRSSGLDVYLPKDAEIKVKLGDNAKAEETILGVMK